jgi:chromate transporter
MTTGQFYAGLALAQAMPGPLFNFAAYLGAVIAQNAGVNAIIGVILCWVGLFAPGIILIFGILPFWGAFRQWQLYRRALPGLNASAVGLIVASVFQLTFQAWTTSPFPTTSICIGILVYGATEILSVPAPFAVIGGGVVGIIGWAANMV